MIGKLLTTFLSALTAGLCLGSTVAPQASPKGDRHTVVVSGHLYSLFVRNKMMSKAEGGLIYTEDYVRAFARELHAIQPEAVFFLGDNTRFATEEEWQMLADVFEDVDCQKIFAAGNHDYRDISTFERFGGVKNGSFVIHDNKYIVLDAKNVLEQEDLDFIEREVADYQEYDNVFILKHYLQIKGVDHEGGVDPYEAYPGYSNWNSKAVPLIAGKVRYVFTGDYFQGQAGRMVQEYEGHEIHYLLNSFLFGRGRRNETNGDGPIMFLVLTFEGDEFTVHPGVVPVDLRDPWYLRFWQPTGGPEKSAPIKKSTRVKLESGFSMSIPPGWTSSETEGELRLVARKPGKNGRAGMELKLYELPGADSVKALEKRLLKGARALHEGFELTERGAFKIGQTQARWAIAPRFRDAGDARGLNVYFVYEDQGYLISSAVSDAGGNYRTFAYDLVELFDIVDSVRLL